MQLPVPLRDAIAAIVEPSAAALSASTAEISRRYRRIAETGKAPAQNLQIQSTAEAHAYLAYRFPATFCATTDALRHVQQILPGLAPASLLDAGAGPATATLAALTFWPTLNRCTLIEPNPHLCQAGAELLAQTKPSAQIAWQSQKLGAATAPALPKHDVTILSYMLNEIAAEPSPEAFAQTVATMWAQTAKLLLILEPGTPFGQQTILRARDLLLSQGAHIAAPCPHEKPCPLAARFAPEERWCHFSVRVERSKLHKRAKENATVGYEDEKFSYLAVTREHALLPNARLIGAPRGKKLITADLCNADGTAASVTIPKSSPTHAPLRSADWGDAL